MTDAEQLLAAFMPLMQQAVNDAVGEAIARLAEQSVPLDGVLSDIAGATGYVSVPGQPEEVHCTLANSALQIDDHVVVIFYGRGIAYAHGPIAGPPPPV